jgi:hypothetical protein
MDLFKHFNQWRSGDQDRATYVIAEGHIDHLARTAGLMDTPMQRVNGLDTNEQGFVAHYRKKISDRGLNVQAQLNGLHQEIRQLRDDLLSGKQASFVTLSEQQVDPALAAITAQYTPELKRAGTEAETAQRMFRYFQVTNDLNDRLPHVPTAAWKLYSLMGVFVLIEALVLATFYADMGDNGLIGGALTAAMLSLLNVLLAFGLGHSLRYLNGHKRQQKIFAVVGSLVCLSMLLASIAFAVQYRYAAKDQIVIVAEEGPDKGTYTGKPTDKTTITHYDQDEEDRALWVARRAWENTKLHGFIAPEVQSWWLMFSSLAFAALVVTKTYRSRDPFPGYWEAYQHWQDRVGAEKRAAEGYFSQLQAVYDNQRKQVIDIAQSADTSATKIRRLADEHQQAVSSMLQFLTETEDACRRSLSRYRDVKRLIATRPEIHEEDARISFDEPRRQFLNFAQNLEAKTTCDRDVDIEDRVIEIHRLADATQRRLLARQESMLVNFRSTSFEASETKHQPRLALPMAA